MNCGVIITLGITLTASLLQAQDRQGSPDQLPFRRVATIRKAFAYEEYRDKLDPKYYKR